MLQGFYNSNIVVLHRYRVIQNIHNIIFNAYPKSGAVTGDYVDFTVVARPVDYLKVSNIIHLRINLINTRVDALISGGNLDITWDEINGEDGYGEDIYLGRSLW